MTIKDLIKKLKTFSIQDAEVFVTVGDKNKDVLNTPDFEVFAEPTESGYDYIKIYVDKDTYLKEKF